MNCNGLPIWVPRLSILRIYTITFQYCGKNCIIFVSLTTFITWIWYCHSDIFTCTVGVNSADWQTSLDYVPLLYLLTSLLREETSYANLFYSELPYLIVNHRNLTVSVHISFSISVCSSKVLWLAISWFNWRTTKKWTIRHVEQQRASS